LSDIPSAFSMDTSIVDGTDLEAVRELVSGLVERTRKGEGPFFIESRTSRWPGNYGNFPQAVGGDTDVNWTWGPESAPESIRKWEENSDPVLLYARKIIERGVLTRERLAEIDQMVQDEMRAAAEFALNSPLPKPEAALEHAYA
jgi:acetoin:2,6-dichlorophenolindophenol oxidoreductase subunit alpha